MSDPESPDSKPEQGFTAAEELRRKIMSTPLPPISRRTPSPEPGPQPDTTPPGGMSREQIKAARAEIDQLFQGRRSARPEPERVDSTPRSFEAARAAGALEPLPELARHRPQERTADPSSEAREARHELSERIVKAARGKTRIHTSLDDRTKYAANGAEHSSNGGYTELGDDPGLSGGLEIWPAYLAEKFDDPYTNADRRVTLQAGAGVSPERLSDVVEVFSFTPVEEPETVEKTRTEWHRLKRETVKYKERTGNMLSVATMNPETEQAEPAIAFEYSYCPRRSPKTEAELGLSEYQDPPTGRPGNLLLVRTILPASIARDLQGALSEDPMAVREVVEQLVMERGGISADAWFGRGEHHRPIRPPYSDNPNSVAAQPHYIERVNPDGNIWKVVN